MLIGFIGKMGSGKSTATDFLVEHYQFTKHNFKDGLDAELLELYPTVLAHLGGFEMAPRDVIKKKPTPDWLRELKQKHGTEVRRGQDPEYWVKKWIDKYQHMFDQNVCVDDVRFFNEVEAVKRFDGIIIRIERPDIKDTGEHESETQLDNYEADYVITADPGDINMIQMSLESIIEKENGIRIRKEDSDNSCADAEYIKTTFTS